jgi:hypothetical protein
MPQVSTISGGIAADSFFYTNITTATTTTVKSGSGTLVRIVNNKKLANGVVTIYDNTAGSGTKIGTITNPATLLDNQQTYEYQVAFNTGLTIVTSAAEDLTVVWR